MEREKTPHPGSYKYRSVDVQRIAANGLVHRLRPAIQEPEVQEALSDAYLGDLYAESGQTIQGSFSAVSKPNFASK